ncbi:MAG TPA: MFS transporter [Chloroflexota bacterium]|nr:MFS transporter [Chloroflexota bacterium]
MGAAGAAGVPDPTAGRPDVTPLRSTAFRWLWCSTLGSAGAQGLERTATAWLALEAGGGLAVGLALAARAVPSLLLGLAAGTLADRVDRRRQLVAVAAAMLPLTAVVATFVGVRGVATWYVVALSFALGCLQVFDGPARQALVLDTVPDEAAASAFALHAFGARLATALGALGAGVLIPQSGVSSCYLAVAGLYVLSAALVAPVRVAPVQPVGFVHPPFRRALLDAARLVIDVPAVRILSVAGITCEIFAFSHGTALPVLARDVLAAGPAGLGTLNAGASVGGTAAVVLLAVLPGRVRREPLLGAAFLLYGGALLALGASGVLAAAVALMVVVGACAAAFDVLRQTLIQTAVPVAQRGRAAGVWVLGVGSAPVGHLEMGLLVAALGAPGALLINGAVVVAAAGALLLRAPSYRWATRPTP